MTQNTKQEEQSREAEREPFLQASPSTSLSPRVPSLSAERWTVQNPPRGSPLLSAHLGPWSTSVDAVCQPPNLGRGTRRLPAPREGRPAGPLGWSDSAD